MNIFTTDISPLRLTPSPLPLLEGKKDQKWKENDRK
jgi:hypothetical protein